MIASNAVNLSYIPTQPVFILFCLIPNQQVSEKRIDEVSFVVSLSRSQ